MSGAALITAIESGILENVTAELDNGAPADYIGAIGTPLQIAVSHNNLTVINLLLARGATVDLQNQSGETALGIAILNQRPAIVQRLLDMGANPNHKDGEGYTLLHLAASGGSLSIVEKLLQAGATVDATKEIPGNNNNNNQNNQNNQNNDEEDEEKGNTALFFAAMNGRLPIVQRLLAAGADRHHENESGETLEDVATPEVLAYLQQLQQGGRRSRKATRRKSTRRGSRKATRRGSRKATRRGSRKASRRSSRNRRSTRRH
jgi:ankyrin repeat protein